VQTKAREGHGWLAVRRAVCVCTLRAFTIRVGVTDEAGEYGVYASSTAQTSISPWSTAMDTSIGTGSDLSGRIRRQQGASGFCSTSSSA
jgi:hypothetical protein